jgi:DegV family protein with EDD domain
MIAIITDVAAGFKDHQKISKDIYLVKQKVFTQNNLQAEKDISIDEFYKDLKLNGPGTTAAPTIEEFTETFNEVIKDGYKKVVVILMGKHLSSTYNNAMVAAKELDSGKLEILVYDTNTILMSEQAYVYDLLKNKYDDIKEVETNFKKLNSRLVFCLTDINTLKKGGRISPAQALAANLLGIKPIIHVSDGKLEVLSKARTEKKALKIMTEYLDDIDKSKIVNIGVLVVGSSIGNEVIELLESKYKQQEIIKTDFLHPVIGNHTSIPIFGISITWKD